MDCPDVVFVQGQVAVIPPIKRGHQGAELVRVGEAKTVPKLMSSCLQQVRSPVAVDRPKLGIVKVGVATVDWEIGMSEGPSSPVKGVAVPMVVSVEADVNVYLVRYSCQAFSVVPIREKKYIECFALYLSSVFP